MEPSVVDYPHNGGHDDLCSRCKALGIVSLFGKCIDQGKDQDCAVTELDSPQFWLAQGCDFCNFLLEIWESLHGSTIRPGSQDRLAAYSTNYLGRQDQKPGRRIKDCYADVEDTTVLGLARSHGHGSLHLHRDLGYIQLVPDDAATASLKLRPRVLAQDIVSYRTILEWLGLCLLHHHEECGQSNSMHPAGLYLIDCWDLRVVRAPPSCRYVALSYVWGATATAAHDSSGQICLEDLPRTIRHAIIVTRSLGLNFLWVDRHCIRENDKAHRVRQIRQMHRIYEQAYLTIIAATGVNADSGLPGVDRQPRLPQPQVQIGSSRLVSTLPFVESELQQSVWRRRAWTFQEGRLSRRRLIFTDRQVYFECLRSHACEAIDDPTSFRNVAYWRQWRRGPAGRHFQLGPAGVFSSDVVQKLNSVLDDINDYSAKELSQESDALDAITGVLQKYTEVAQIHFHWGMPYYFDPLPESRHYITAAIASLVVTRHDPDRRPDFPSWSWVGWKRSHLGSEGTSTWRYPLCPSIAIHVELLAGSIVPWTQFVRDLQTPSRFLHIAGPTMDVTLTVNPSPYRADLRAEVKGTCRWESLWLELTFRWHRWSGSTEADVRESSKRQGPCILIQEYQYPGRFHFVALEKCGEWYEIAGVAKVERHTGMFEVATALAPLLPRRTFRIG